jgi:hypothetical protein
MSVESKEATMRWTDHFNNDREAGTESPAPKSSVACGHAECEKTKKQYPASWKRHGCPDAPFTKVGPNGVVYTFEERHFTAHGEPHVEFKVSIDGRYIKTEVEQMDIETYAHFFIESEFDAQSSFESERDFC